MIKNDTDKIALRADGFDQCFAELSPASKDNLKKLIEYIEGQLGSGGGTKSAKELVFQVMRFMYKNGEYQKDNHMAINKPANVEPLYRVQWLERLQPTDVHRTMFETAPIPLSEASRIEREMRGDAACSEIKIVENKS